MRTAAIHWSGSRAPTRAELRAIGLGVRSGRIRAGDRVGPGTVARRANPSGPERAYREFHWGNAHRRTDRVTLPNYAGGLYKLGDLVAVEYEARKGNESAIWVHKFSRPRPALTATAAGQLGPIVGGRAYVTERGIEK